MGNKAPNKDGSKTIDSLNERVQGDESIQDLINFAILTDPHNEFDGEIDDEAIEDDIKIMVIVDAMKDRGYRPITIAEFVNEQCNLRSNQTIANNIVLWKPIQVSSIIIDDKSKRSIPNPNLSKDIVKKPKHV
jgi:hypothetical protein